MFKMLNQVQECWSQNLEYGTIVFPMYTEMWEIIDQFDRVGLIILDAPCLRRDVNQVLDNLRWFLCGGRFLLGFPRDRQFC